MVEIPTMGEFHGREHHYPIRVFYEDTDFTGVVYYCLLYTSPSPRDQRGSRMPSSA